MGTPTLAPSALRCPLRGSNSRLGTALRREWTPTLAAVTLDDSACKSKEVEALLRCVLKYV
jgi:hypothetical protein